MKKPSASAAPTASKDPFERIRSGVERKQVFQKAIDSKSQFVLKMKEDELEIFQPIRLLEDALLLKASKTCSLQGLNEAIGNFHLETDRFFVHGAATFQGSEVLIPFDAELFRLQRRRSFRVDVPRDYKVGFNLSDLEGKPIYVEGWALDVSAGGLRVEFPSRPEVFLKVGEAGKGFLHIPGKTGTLLPIRVAHVRETSPAQYGFECLQSDMSLSNRLQILALDLQKRQITQKKD